MEGRYDRVYEFEAPIDAMSHAGKGEAGGGFLPEVRGGLCGYGAEDPDLRGGGRVVAGGAVHAV